MILFPQEEEMPEVEIDIDDLLEVNNEDERALKLQVSSGSYMICGWMWLEAGMTEQNLQ